MSWFDEPTFDGTSEAVAMGVVMAPPEGFVEHAVARGLALVQAEEALDHLAGAGTPAEPVANDRPAVDTIPPERETLPYLAGDEPRRRRDSGVIRLPSPSDELSESPTEPAPRGTPDEPHRM